VAKTIKECGIDHFFYVTGGMTSMMPVIEGAGVKMVLCRSEMAAGNMANGYSRVTGRPSICYGQHGAAAAILASTFYESMRAHSPVMALTGSIPTMQKDGWRFQECYEMSYFEPMCKFNVDVTDVSRLPHYIRTALQVAVTGCPGPTHVNMHNDMADAVAEMPEIYGDPTYFHIPPFRPRADSEKVVKAAKMLTDADRPILICGGGVHLSNAYDEVRELAESLAIPVATDYNGKGCFPEGSLLYAGVIGVYGSEFANDLVRASDVVFLIGTRVDSHATEEGTAPEVGASKIIHLDIDATAIGRNYKADVALVGDAKLTLQEMLATVRAMASKRAKRGRIQEVAKAVEDWQTKVKPLMESNDIPIKPQRLISEISKVLRSRDIVFSDTGHMLCWTLRFLRLKETGLTYIPCQGTLGSSLAMAMGGAFGAGKDQRVIDLTGDGGMGYNIAELETISRCRDHVPFVVIINNNSSLGQTRPYFDQLTSKETPWINYSDFSHLNYAKIAENFGCYGVRVEKVGELAEALRYALDAGKPAVVDVVTDKREYPPIGVIRRGKKEAFPGIPTY
jgi:acetolactate synthase-1/2/3 large subunit